METKARQEQRYARNAVRKVAVREGIVQRNDGQDLDHIKPLSKGGKNTLGNIRVVSPAVNRSVLRNPDGSVKSQYSHKERKKK